MTIFRENVTLRETALTAVCRAAGSIWTDFKPQIEGLDRKRFTVVAWDPVGYGKSRPPDRTFPDDFFERDATHARNLMTLLGYERFSLIGWSDGGITSLILASKFPENVRKMVSHAANSYVTPEEIEIYKSTYTEVIVFGSRLESEFVKQKIIRRIPRHRYLVGENACTDDSDLR